MKTVCKKLLSLMLVAILLISAVPMAFATEGDAAPVASEPVKYQVCLYQNGTCTKTLEFTLNEGEAGTFTPDYAKTLFAADIAGWNFVEWVNTFTNKRGETVDISYNDVAGKDGYVAAMFTKDTTTTPTTPTTPETTAPTNPSTCENHAWDAGKVTKEPTCTAEGEKTFTCTKCSKTKTERIPALDHNFVNDKCTRCNERESHELTFIYLDTKGNEVRAYQRIKHGENISFPSAYNVEGKRIDYWFNLKDDNYAEGAITYQNTTGQKWEYGRPLVYKAHYIVDTVQDNTAKLTIWANYYAGGVRQTLKLYDKSFTKSSYDNEMYRWLNDKAGGIATIQNEVKSHFGDDYQWADNNNYYDVNGKAIPSTMKDDGAKAIYINLTAKDATKAKVLVYVHLRDSKNNNKIIVTADRVIPMENYVKGDVVYASNVQKAVEGKYKFKEMSKLYTAQEFDRLIDGQNPTGANAVTVPEGGIEIHVVLNNATNKTTSNADKSNPKTGDNIDVVFTTMTISAMGLAAVAVLKKRKMI